MSFNAYWYAGLSLFCLVLLAYSFYRIRSVHALLFFLAVCEIAYLIEAVIYIFLGSYTYHPGMIRNRAFYDSHLGGITSNLITLPTLALLLSVFRLGWFWIFVCIGFLASVEWLFVKLQIYTLHWWRIGYTSAGLLVYFPFAKWLYRRMCRPLHGWIRTVFVFLCIGPLSGTLHFLPFMFFGNRVYRPGWFPDAEHDTSAFGIVYYISLCILISLLVHIRWKRAWFPYALLAMIVAAGMLVMVLTGLLHIAAWWDPSLYMLSPLLVMRIAQAIGERLSEGAARCRNTADLS